MIISLIVILLLIIFMAFFIGKNLSNTCNFWFFNTFSEVQVSVLVLIAFGAGILVSILAVLIFKIRKSGAKEETNSQEDTVKKELKKHEKKERKLNKKNEQPAASDDTIVQSTLES